jgi:hypothetical protein
MLKNGHMSFDKFGSGPRSDRERRRTRMKAMILGTAQLRASYLCRQPLFSAFKGKAHQHYSMLKNGRMSFDKFGSGPRSYRERRRTRMKAMILGTAQLRASYLCRQPLFSAFKGKAHQQLGFLVPRHLPADASRHIKRR